jgi:hypothetical protein
VHSKGMDIEEMVRKIAGEPAPRRRIAGRPKLKVKDMTPEQIEWRRRNEAAKRRIAEAAVRATMALLGKRGGVER